MSNNIAITQTLLDTPSVERFVGQSSIYNLDFYLQRGNAWTNEQRSKLIHSLLLNYPIPTLIFCKYGDIYNVIDGKQRSTTIIWYVQNKFALHENTENIILSDVSTSEQTEYVIKGMYFRDLPQQVKSHLLTRIIKVEICSNLNEKQQSELLYRLNNGTAIKKLDKAKIVAYNTVTPIVLKIKESDLFTRKVNIRESDKQKTKIDEKLIFSLIGKECGLIVNDNFEVMVKNIEESDNFTEELIENINQNLEYLNLAMPTKVKYLNSSWFIPVYQMVKKYKDTLNERDFYSLMNEVFNNHYNDIHVEGDWNNNNALNERIRLLEIECNCVVRKDDVAVK